MRGIERFLSVEMYRATKEYAIASKSIVGTLHVTMVEEYAFGAIERIHVETTDEAHVSCHHPVATAISHMSLRDGITTAVPAQFGL
jgi:hypothetical protein